MAKPLIVLNRKGVSELLKSPGVRADLARRAKAIADAAGDGMEASSQVGRTRARASVVTATFSAKEAEARNRTLSRAFNAGRR